MKTFDPLEKQTAQVRVKKEGILVGGGVLLYPENCSQTALVASAFRLGTGVAASQRWLCWRFAERCKSSEVRSCRLTKM